MEKMYRIGTRKSKLALKQVQEISEELKKFYPQFNHEIIGIDTYGDEDKNTPIARVEGSDFFTREIDKAVIEGKVDFAIHSAKDLPDELDSKLYVAAFTESKDKDDVLVSKDSYTLDELPSGAAVGTSSLRRKEGIKKYREDLEVLDIRGNVEKRVQKLDKGKFDAIVLAAIGLIRLGFGEKITQRIPYSIIEPHSLQGSLALVIRRDNYNLMKKLSVLDSEVFRKEYYEKQKA